MSSSVYHPTKMLKDDMKMTESEREIERERGRERERRSKQ
jgi:hypothetical protein